MCKRGGRSIGQWQYVQERSVWGLIVTLCAAEESKQYDSGKYGEQRSVEGTIVEVPVCAEGYD